MDEVVVAITAILCVGGLAQWLGWRMRMPAIVFLLAAGLVVGPLTGWLEPDSIMGDTLFPVVSMAVAVILFEGALGLGSKGIRDAGRTVWLLLTVGAGVTLVCTAVAAQWIFDIPAGLAWVLSAILVVTGPTVIGPLVRAIGLHGRPAKILEAEGTLIDPMGAIIAVLMFETFFEEEATAAWPVELALTVGIGLAAGLVGAGLILWLLGRYLVPDHLHNIVTLATVLTVFTVADSLQPEAGLVGVTAMGVAVAAGDKVDVQHILEFNEVLRTLFITGLFILLGARIAPETLTSLGWRNLAFLAVLVVLVRPAAVFLSTVGSGLGRGERAFIGLTAPRGIVAAAIASVFSIQLTENDIDGAQLLVAATFTVIAGTVLFSGLFARPLATRLGLLRTGADSIVVLGSNPMARELARALAKVGAEVTLVGMDRQNLASARMDGLRTVAGSVMDDDTWAAAEVDAADTFVALSTRDEVNAVSVRHATRLLGRRNVFQVVPNSKRARSARGASPHIRGRPLFAADATLDRLDSRLESGWHVKATTLTDEFGPRDYYSTHPLALPLCTERDGSVHFRDAGQRLNLRAGDTVVSLLPKDERQEAQVRHRRRLLRRRKKGTATVQAGKPSD
jgi:NhaP-type Na+/H+ or K+/H+ antiporter